MYSSPLDAVVVHDQRLPAHSSHLEDQPVEDLLALLIKAVAVALELFVDNAKVHGWHNVKESV
jgi:hypothetical protein